MLIERRLRFLGFTGRTKRENRMKEEKDYKIIYSLKIMKELVKRGYFPIQTLPNPKDTRYNCWIFENNEELETIATQLMNKD